MPQAEIGQLGAVGGGVRTQLRGAEHAPVLVDDVQASPAGVHETAPVADRLGTQRLGTPGDRPGQRRPVPASGRGGGQVLVRHRGPAQGQGDSADGQLRQWLMGRREMGQRPGAAPGVPEQGGGRRTSLHAGAHLDQLGLRSPPAPTLPVEEPTRLGGPVQGRRGLAGGERGRGRGEQQLGPLGRPAMDPVQLLDRGVGLLHGVRGQSRRGERGAPVDAQVGLGGAEPLESLRRLVEAAQRVRQVAEPEGDQTAVHGDFHGL